MIYSNQTVSIRRATVEDAPAIHEITLEAFAKYARDLGRHVAALDETVEDVEREVKEQAIFVAVLDGVIVGSVRVKRVQGVAYLGRFGVKASARGRGIGEKLVAAVETFAVENKLGAIILHTASTMLTLVRFYYGLGFYIQSTDTSSGYIRALLVKPLSNPATFKLENWYREVKKHSVV